jgi:hypothetical protein
VLAGLFGRRASKGDGADRASSIELRHRGRSSFEARPKTGEHLRMTEPRPT